MPKPLPPPSLAPTQHLSPQALQLTVDRLFTPFLRPSRYQPQPSPPSLAASRLPPPAAEIDERPRYRVRRFRLWRDNAPTLRLAVLDPKRRPQLRRYQAFAIPNRSFPTKGSLAIKWTPPPRNPATSVPTHKPVGTAQYNTASHTMGPPAVPAKTPKWLRQAKYKRLLQNKYVLDQEYERRFRKGMSELMEWVLNFETENLLTWAESPLAWKSDVNVDFVTDLIHFFKKVRLSSASVFDYVDASKNAPVRGRDEAKSAVDNEKRAKQARREARDAKKLRAGPGTGVNAGVAAGSANLHPPMVLPAPSPTVGGANSKPAKSGPGRQVKIDPSTTTVPRTVVSDPTPPKVKSQQSRQHARNPSTSLSPTPKPLITPKSSANPIPSPTPASAPNSTPTRLDKRTVTDRNPPKEILERWTKIINESPDSIKDQITNMLTELKTSGSTPTDLKEIEVGIDTPDKGVVKMTLAEFIYYSSLDSDETESDTDSDLDHAHKPDELGLHATRGHVDDTIFTSRRLPSPGEDDVQSGDSSVTDEERSIPSGHLLAVEENKDGSISEPASRTLDSSRTPHPDQLANNDSQIVFGDLNMDEDTALPGFSERPDDSLSWVSDDGSDSENSILTTRASRVGDTLDDEMGDTLGTVSGFTR